MSYVRARSYDLLSPFINGIGALVTTFLGLRFLLKLLGASAGAPFVRWMYDVTEPLLYPFKGMFPAPAIERGFILEFSTLFAIVAYSLVFYAITYLIAEIQLRATEEPARHHNAGKRV